jgi:outer membrane immunogenic protein
MKKYVGVICSIFVFGTVLIHVPSARADDLDQVLKRLTALERANTALERENTALRERVRRLEGKYIVEPNSPQRVIMDAKTQARPEPAQSPYAAVYKAAPPVPAPFTWTGLYVGGHIGWGWQVATLNDPFSACDLFLNCVTGDPIRDMQPHGFLGGGQFGWNYQINRLVVGGELSFSATSAKGGRVDTISETSTFGGVPISSVTETRAWSDGTNWLATATTRLGYAWDNLLLYTKGGIAAARNTYSLFDSTLATSPVCCTSSVLTTTSQTGADTRTGLTVGIGAEWAFWKNWSATAEYDYADLGARPVKLTGTATTVITNVPPFGSSSTTSEPILAVSIDQRIQMIRLGLNYRFQSEADTVVANY